MKKSLLFAAMAAVGLSAAAETQVYWFTADKTGAEYDAMGTVYNVSPNGEYAFINDTEGQECFLWKKSDPGKLTLLNWEDHGKLAPMDGGSVSDNGTVVASWRPYGQNQYVPFYQALGGERVNLPMPSWASNTNAPIAISEDENIIGGYIGGSITSKTIFDAETGEPNTWGGYYPIIWVKGTDGEYTQYTRKDIDMADHQGFYPRCMYTDGTLEGTYLGGSLYCGAASTISALFNYTKDAFIKWNDLTVVEVPFMYKGKPMGAYKYELIDGKRDHYFSDKDDVDAHITAVDGEGHFFGTRFHVGEIKETDPEQEDFAHSYGDTYTWGYYDVKTGEWTEVAGDNVVNAAINKDLFFVGHDMYKAGLNGATENIVNALGISTNGKTWQGVAAIAKNAKVLGMSYTSTDEIGATHSHPFMVVLDEAITSIDDLVIDGDAKQLVLVYGGTIEVTGAQQVAVYDLNGVQVSNKAVSNVGAGTYVVVADGKSHKVLVK